MLVNMIASSFLFYAEVQFNHLSDVFAKRLTTTIVHIKIIMAIFTPSVNAYHN